MNLNIIIYLSFVLFLIYLIIFYEDIFLRCIKYIILYIISFEIIRRLIPKDFMSDSNYNSIGFYNFSGLSKIYDFLIIYLPLAIIILFFFLKLVYEYKK